MLNPYESLRTGTVIVMRLAHAITKRSATVTRTLLANGTPSLCDLAARLEPPGCLPTRSEVPSTT